MGVPTVVMSIYRNSDMCCTHLQECQRNSGMCSMHIQKFWWISNVCHTHVQEFRPDSVHVLHGRCSGRIPICVVHICKSIFQHLPDKYPEIPVTNMCHIHFQEFRQNSDMCGIYR